MTTDGRTLRTSVIKSIKLEDRRRFEQEGKGGACELSVTERIELLGDNRPLAPMVERIHERFDLARPF